MTDTIYINSDNTLIIDDVKHAIDGSYINTATVVCTLKDASGSNVSGQSWPLTLDYVAASNGKYSGTLEDGLSLTEGENYTAEITITLGSTVVEIKKILEAAVNR